MQVSEYCSQVHIAIASSYLHLVTEFSVHNCNANIYDCFDFDLEWVKVRQSKPCTEVPLEALVYLITVLKIPRLEFSGFL